MPNGVDTYVEDGFAVIDFVDPGTRGPGITALIESVGPGGIETLTREGPRRLYRVPEGNAREAGLLDEPADGDRPRGDLGAAEALASASPAGARPTQPTSRNVFSQTLRGGEYRDIAENVETAVDQAVVLGNTSVASTLSDVPGESALAPLHADVIARVHGTVGHGPLDRESARQAVPGTVPDLTLSTPPAQAASDDLDASDAPRILVPDENDKPTMEWTVADLQKYAKDHDIDLDGATRKADIFAKVT